MILFWGLIVLIAVGLVRLVARDRPDAGKGPREILDERLARGEIDEAEHERKRHLLG